MKMTPSKGLRHGKVLLLTFTAMSGLIAVPAFAQTAQTQTHTPSKAHAKKAKAPARKTVATAPVAVAAPAVAVPTAPRVDNSRTVALAAAAPEPATESVVVTGSLLRDPNLTSASPMTHMTRQDLQQRGIKTVTDALQQLSSNGAGNLTNAFSANGAFAGGASAPSLRGLSTDSTLVLMDGQRLSYYPLSDDGERNFVDTNWMPSSIVETIDVLKDGGSATYGADAVAGVINFITRKEIKGFEGNAEGGLSQRGDNGHRRLYATYGHGDLANDGYNFYINSEYQEDDALYNRQLGYPYNSADLTGIGGSDARYGSTSNFVSSTTPIVRPNGSTGPWGLLNPAAGCRGSGVPVSGSVTGASGISSSCAENQVGDYYQISPQLRRISATAHFTANVTEHSQFTSMFTYSQALSTFISHVPYTTVSASQSNQAQATGVLLGSNPNNPTGQDEQIMYRFGDIVPTTSEFSQNFRGSARYNGWVPSKWGSDWKYDVNFVGMTTDLDTTYTGYPTVNGVDEALSGAIPYNFVDPSGNSKSVINAIAPKDVVHAHTQEYSGEATLSKGLFKLPGGMVDAAIGGNIRYEELNDPNGNPLDQNNLGAQYMGINPFNAQGHRWVESGFFEVGIPVIKMLNADVSGRYDHYSEGFSHFSPKVGVTFKPVKQLTLRGTFSKGFRVPSFAETGGSNVGYVTYTPTNASFLAAHPDAYGQAYALGLNTSGNPNLKPEISTNFSGGMIFSPTNWASLSIDYYYIKKEHYIAPNPVSYNTVASDYLAGTPLPAGVTVTPDVPDTQNPGGSRRPGIINMGYINTNKLMTDGVDAELTINHRLPGKLHDVRWISRGEATFVHNYNLTLPDGEVQHYAGTIGPYEAVSASGTPRWKANWSNTLIYKDFSFTPTVYYTSGYKTIGEDATGAGSRHDCANAQQGYQGVPVGQCHVKSFWDVDLTLSYRISPRWTVYSNIYNLLGFRAPYDYATYGSYLYNSSWAQKGIVLRSFQFGVTATL